MKRNLLYIAAAFLLLFTDACRKDPVTDDPGAILHFSDDTLLFDTVFTSVGSVTKQFKVYNHYSKKIIIKSLRLATGSSSNFRLNVNGLPGKNFSDIEIPAKDSLYIFVEVTVDPNSTNTPVVITDSILFEVNGNVQDVDLLAWGQDAYFHKPPPGYLLYTLNCNEVWNNDKPHVIYGYAVVDSSCTLSINAGAKVYVHGNSGLIVYKAGTLKVNGTLTSPVFFQGDRLEYAYAEEPGQWGMHNFGGVGIWLSAESKENTINYAIIKNGIIGLKVDTMGSLNPTLKMDNTIITNMSVANFYAQGSYVKATNCLFANSGGYLAALTIGGLYDFRHCTFANYWSYSDRKNPAILLNNYYTGTDNIVYIRQLAGAYFGNCIVYGNSTNEIGFDFHPASPAGYASFTFENSLLKIDPAVNTATADYVNVVKNADPRFINPGENNYELDALSAAQNKGKVSIGNAIPLDLKGISRVTWTPPDMGAYEREEN